MESEAWNSTRQIPESAGTAALDALSDFRFGAGELPPSFSPRDAARVNDRSVQPSSNDQPKAIDPIASYYDRYKPLAPSSEPGFSNHGRDNVNPDDSRPGPDRPQPQPDPDRPQPNPYSPEPDPDEPRPRPGPYRPRPRPRPPCPSPGPGT